MSELDPIQTSLSGLATVDTAIQAVPEGGVDTITPQPDTTSNTLRVLTPEQFNETTPPPDWQKRAQELPSDQRWENAPRFAEEQQQVYENDVLNIATAIHTRNVGSIESAVLKSVGDTSAAELGTMLGEFAEMSLEANPWRKDNLKLPADITLLTGHVEKVATKLYQRLHPEDPTPSPEKVLASVSARDVLRAFTAESVVRFLNNLDDAELETETEFNIPEKPIVVEPVSEAESSPAAGALALEAVTSTMVSPEVADLKAVLDPNQTEDGHEGLEVTDVDQMGVTKKERKQNLLGNFLRRYGLDFQNAETRKLFLETFNYVNEVLDFVDIQSIVDAFFDTHTSHGHIAAGNLEWFAKEEENSEQDTLFEEILRNEVATHSFLKNLYEEEEDIDKWSPEQKMDKLEKFAQNFKPSTEQDIKNKARETWRRAFVESLGIIQKAPPTSLETYSTVTVSAKMIEGLAEKIKERH